MPAPGSVTAIAVLTLPSTSCGISSCLRLVRGEALDRLRVELVDAPDPGDSAEGARDLLHEDRLDRAVAALAAELLVDPDPEEARLGHVLPQLLGEVRAVVVLLALDLERVLLGALCR